jgi:hypothetical protein
MKVLLASAGVVAYESRRFGINGSPVVCSFCPLTTMETTVGGESVSREEKYLEGCDKRSVPVLLQSWFFCRRRWDGGCDIRGRSRRKSVALGP